MILFVGDTDESLSRAAKAVDDSAFLIDGSNYQQVLDQHQYIKVAYTSVADLPKMSLDRNIFFELLDRADQIYYYPPARWSDHTEQFDHWSAQRITEYLLVEIHREKNNVHGLHLAHWHDNAYVALTDQRQSESTQLWVAGCSIPHGTGVDPTKKFGALLANRLDLPVSHLTKPGAGIVWAADQILRSDLRSGDIMIWAVTAEYRYCVWDKKLQHVNPYSFQASQDRNIGSGLENMVYNAAICIHQVINFCEKLHVRLILLPTITTETLRLLFHDCPYWCAPKYRSGFLDIGSDGVHPGPKQHAAWADFCFELLGATK